MFLFQLEKIDSKLSLSTPEMVMFLVRKLFAIARGSRIINTYFEFGNIFGNDKRFICRRTNGSKKKLLESFYWKICLCCTFAERPDRVPRWPWGQIRRRARHTLRYSSPSRPFAKKMIKLTLTFKRRTREADPYRVINQVFIILGKKGLGELSLPWFQFYLCVAHLSPSGDKLRYHMRLRTNSIFRLFSRPNSLTHNGYSH